MLTHNIATSESVIKGLFDKVIRRLEKETRFEFSRRLSTRSHHMVRGIERRD